MPSRNSANGGGGSGGGPGVGERAPASRRTGREAKRPGGGIAVSQKFDPASRPDGEPTLADEEQREFHATHFTADPRGAAMAGTAPGESRRGKRRGGSPPAAPGRAANRTKPKPKRRGS